jgi:hypothetical protein
MRTGSRTATVTGFSWVPPLHTRASAKLGIQFATGSPSSNAPSS